MRYVEIAIPSAGRSAFTYKVPDGLFPKPGMRVLVPFRKKTVIGICIDVAEGGDASPYPVFTKLLDKEKRPLFLDDSKIRSIENLPDDGAVISENVLKLIKWISSYYIAPIGEVMKVALPPLLFRPVEKGSKRGSKPVEIETICHARHKLNAGQEIALKEIILSVENGTNLPFLLQGVTGSGKTEVYLNLFEELIKKGKRNLLLVPEIGLTPQLTGRAKAHFGDRVAVYHSGLTDLQRLAEWKKMIAGEVDVVIGTRSALFAPLSNLGAIVVDEEHDTSYKQDDGVMYSARDFAVARASIEMAPVVLGSATPSIESLANVTLGKYKHLILKERPGGTLMPSIEIVDLRNKPKRRTPEKTEGMKRRREFAALSPELYDAIEETLSRSEQVLLYIGRRGFAGSLQCNDCGEVFSCPNCSIALTPHIVNPRNDKKESVLICHYCDFKLRNARSCKNCGSDVLMPVGFGTERLEAELKDFFPSARVARFDSDTVTSALKRNKILSDMRQGKIDILIGTQMVTKGHDFPSVTLVGVVAADVALHLPDFRAAERTFQLLVQVSGRAGRRDKQGRVLIQTRQPAHISFTAAATNNAEAFVKEELAARKNLSYPPFTRMANFKISSVNEDRAKKAAQITSDEVNGLLKKFGAGEGFSVLGPAPAPISKLRGRLRWQLILKAPSAGALTKIVTAARGQIEPRLPSGTRFTIDIDPLNLL